MSIDIAVGLLSYMGARKAARGEIAINCPFCIERLGKVDTKRKFYMNLEKGMAQCFRCEWKTRDLAAVLRTIVGDASIAQSLAELEEIGSSAGAPSDRTAAYSRATATACPSTPVLLDLFSDSLEEAVTRARVVSYLRAKGLYFSEMEAFGIKAVVADTPMVFFPCFTTKGLLYFYMVRAIEKGKHIVPSDDRDINYYTKLPRVETSSRAALFGEHSNRFGRRRVWIVEGAFDAISLYRLGEFAVALNGKALTDEKAIRLAAMGMERYTIMLDADVPADTLIRNAQTLGDHVGPEKVYIKKLAAGDPGDWLRGAPPPSLEDVLPASGFYAETTL